MDMHVFQLFRGQVFLQVCLVIGRENYVMDTRTLGRQDLFLHPADRKNVSTQRDFAGHGGQGTYRASCNQRHQSGSHGDSRRRAVFRNPSRRHVNVDVVLGEEILRYPENGRIRPHPGQSCLHGFLHHLADLSGHGETALALHGVGFDKQHVAAGRRPGQTYNHTCALGALGNFALNANLNSA